jgi:hypothetical protein
MEDWENLPEYLVSSNQGRSLLKPHSERKTLSKVHTKYLCQSKNLAFPWTLGVFIWCRKTKSSYRFFAAANFPDGARFIRHLTALMKAFLVVVEAVSQSYRVRGFAQVAWMVTRFSVFWIGDFRTSTNVFFFASSSEIGVTNGLGGKADRGRAGASARGSTAAFATICWPPTAKRVEKNEVRMVTTAIGIRLLIGTVIRKPCSERLAEKSAAELNFGALATSYMTGGLPRIE